MIRQRILLMLDNEPGFLSCCMMADMIGCTTHDVVTECGKLETEGVLLRGVADGNKLAYRMIFK